MDRLHRPAMLADQEGAAPCRPRRPEKEGVYRIQFYCPSLALQELQYPVNCCWRGVRCFFPNCLKDCVGLERPGCSQQHMQHAAACWGEPDTSLVTQDAYGFNMALYTGMLHVCIGVWHGVGGSVDHLAVLTWAPSAGRKLCRLACWQYGGPPSRHAGSAATT
jgi:hypothetical protein